MSTTINLMALEICLAMSITGPSSLLSIPYLITSKVYPEIKNRIRMKTITPMIPKPVKAAPPKPVLLKALAILIIEAPPTIAPMIPKITYITNALILFKGYTKASLIISPISIKYSPFIFNQKTQKMSHIEFLLIILYKYYYQKLKLLITYYYILEQTHFLKEISKNKFI